MTWKVVVAFSKDAHRWVSKFSFSLAALSRALCSAACCLLFAAHAQQNQPTRRIALTFDDLPMTVVGNDHIAGPLAETQDISRSILRTLVAHHATAIGFVNEVKLNVQGERDARAALLGEWLQNNMLLGSHGYDHLAFSVVGLAAYEEHFLRSDTITRELMQQHHLEQRYYRNPYVDTGNSAEDEKAFMALLAAHHYKIAPVTVENFDWMFNAAYNDARNRSDKAMMQKVMDVYLAHTRARLERAEQLSKETFSREIPLIMLMHTDRINADHVGDVLQVMEERGYHFVSIDEALADDAYRTPDLYVGNHLGSWLDRWQLALGRPIPDSWPAPPEWISKAYDRIAGKTH